MNDWLASNLEILSTLGSALALYIFIRSAARRDIERLDKRVDKLEEKFDQRFDKIDKRIDKVEANADQRFDKIDQRFESLEAKMERGFADIRQEIRQNRIESILYHGSQSDMKKTGTEK